MARVRDLIGRHGHVGTLQIGGCLLGLPTFTFCVVLMVCRAIYSSGHAGRIPNVRLSHSVASACWHDAMLAAAVNTQFQVILSGTH